MGWAQTHQRCTPQLTCPLGSSSGGGAAPQVGGWRRLLFNDRQGQHAGRGGCAARMSLLTISSTRQRGPCCEAGREKEKPNQVEGGKSLETRVPSSRTHGDRQGQLGGVGGDLKGVVSTQLQGTGLHLLWPDLPVFLGDIGCLYEISQLKKCHFRFLRKITGRPNIIQGGAKVGSQWQRAVRQGENGG